MTEQACYQMTGDVVNTMTDTVEIHYDTRWP